ncbi:hypothetical protein Pmani_026027 [Petrolisthes manimaculis]|uniref:Uncharacterized protein n=1 Tax=Petrolisthes manimaculis TaxID=1843537 RepID=A0AAE1P708_9EUCA|nr:hypothetical protein Pmani_026027 [Petrolisthes manimaculis]
MMMDVCMSRVGGWGMGRRGQTHKLLKRWGGGNHEWDNMEGGEVGVATPWDMVHHNHSPIVLEATERAVGDPSLAEQHLILCTSGDCLQSLNSPVKGQEEELSQAVTRNAQLKDTVTSHEMKIKLEESIKKLSTQRLHNLEKELKYLRRQMSDEFRKQQGMAHNLQKLYEHHKEMIGDFQRELNGKTQEEQRR